MLQRAYTLAGQPWTVNRSCNGDVVMQGMLKLAEPLLASRQLQRVAKVFTDEVVAVKAGR